MQGPYLTTRELADLLKLNIDTVYDLVAKNRIPATKIGNQWRFDEGEIRIWFRQQRNSGTAAPGSGLEV